MIYRGLTIAMFLLMGGVCSAQNDAIIELTPLNDPKTEKEPKPSASSSEEKKSDSHHKHHREEPEPYLYPQAHEFGVPVEVGSDQLNVHRGYWLPGGYEPRSGSPYFNSVPGAPPRGPLGGTVASGYTGGNPQLDRYSGGAYYRNNYNNSYSGGYANTGYGAGYSNGYNGGFNNNSNNANSYNNGGYADGAAMSGGAGGDPYQYHFGPGFYRSGEHGHFRFPFYSYRRPWYHPGFAGYNRDTNLPW